MSAIKAHTAYPAWWSKAVFELREHAAKEWGDLPIHCSTSGGRTSAVMALLLIDAFGSSRVWCSFRNTGREHPDTLRFLRDLSEIHGVPITWLEYQRPTPGSRPREASYRVVSWEDADRTGQPLLDVLETLRSYRAVAKGMGAIAPTPRMRLCTAHAKIATGYRWIRDMVGHEFIDAVGLRADEPRRVSRLKPHRKGAIADCPLAVVGVTKDDVLDFWAGREGDLTIPEHLGNCIGCFLKDEADLATIFMNSASEGEWWAAMESEYATGCPIRVPVHRLTDEQAVDFAVRKQLSPGNVVEHKGRLVWQFYTAPTMRGTGASYARILAELPERARIRAAIAEGVRPTGSARLIRQEQRWALAGPSGISCSCEQAGLLADY